MGEWDRARRAYRVLLGPADPAAGVIEQAGALDLRPGGPVPDSATGPLVLAGPTDLVELRTVVESVTGPGTWPAPPTVEGEVRRGELRLERPAAALGLVGAMEGLIEDRGAMWRTWRTTLELVAAALADVRSLTLEAVVVDARS